MLRNVSSSQAYIFRQTEPGLGAELLTNEKCLRKCCRTSIVHSVSVLFLFFVEGILALILDNV